MKPLRYTLIALTAACGFANAQTTATTTPVGYITHNLAPNPTATYNADGTDTYITPTLVNPAVFAGLTTANPSGLTTLTFSGGVPTGLTGTYIVEITAGAQEGFWAEVTGTSSTTINTIIPMPTGLGGNVNITLRKLPTLGEWIGDKIPGLSKIDGVNTDPPDQIQLLDPVTQVAQIAVYVTTGAGVPVDGWYDSVDNSLLTDAQIYPGEAIVFKKVKADDGPISFVSTGEVKITKTKIDIYYDNGSGGGNWVGQPLAVGGSFGTMNLASQLLMVTPSSPGAPPYDFDFVDVLDLDQNAVSFVSLDPTLAPPLTIVNFVTQEDSTATPVIAEGTGFQINRPANPNPGGTPMFSTLTIPAQVVAP